MHYNHAAKFDNLNLTASIIIDTVHFRIFRLSHINLCKYHVIINLLKNQEVNISPEGIEFSEFEFVKRFTVF